MPSSGKEIYKTIVYLTCKHYRLQPQENASKIHLEQTEKYITRKHNYDLKVISISEERHTTSYLTKSERLTDSLSSLQYNEGTPP